MAADSNDDIYGTQSRSILQFSPSGSQIGKLDVPTSGSTNFGVADIDISYDGHIAAGTLCGDIVITDTNFSEPIVIQTGNSITFVAFVQPPVVPEPATASLLGLVLGGWFLRRNHRSSAP